MGPLLCGSHLIDGGSLDVPWAHHWDGSRGNFSKQVQPDEFVEKGVEAP